MPTILADADADVLAKIPPGKFQEIEPLERRLQKRPTRTRRRGGVRRPGWAMFFPNRKEELAPELWADEPPTAAE